MGRKKGPAKASGVEGKLPPETVETLRGLSTEELEARIVSLSKDEEEAKAFQKADEALAKAKEEVAQLKAPHSDALSFIRNSRTFGIQLLEERGSRVKPA